MNFEKIHQEILKKSSKFKIVKNEIEKNGIIKIQKSKLDLFSFITKTIISQQISDKVAQSLWKKFCFFLKTEYPNKNDITNKYIIVYIMIYTQLNIYKVRLCKEKRKF